MHDAGDHQPHRQQHGRVLGHERGAEADAGHRPPAETAPRAQRRRQGPLHAEQREHRAREQHRVGRGQHEAERGDRNQCHQHRGTRRGAKPVGTTTGQLPRAHDRREMHQQRGDRRTGADTHGRVAEQPGAGGDQEGDAGRMIEVARFELPRPLPVVRLVGQQRDECRQTGPQHGRHENPARSRRPRARRGTGGLGGKVNRYRHGRG